MIRSAEENLALSSELGEPFPKREEKRRSGQAAMRPCELLSTDH